MPIPSVSDAPRAVVDAHGARWLADERPATPDETSCLDTTLGIQPDGWLVFRADSGEERRVPLPPRWRTVTDEALRALLAFADRAPVCGG